MMNAKSTKNKCISNNLSLNWENIKESFIIIYDAIRNVGITSISELEKNYPDIWTRFVNCVLLLVKCMMYQYVKIGANQDSERKSGNYEKVLSLRMSGFKKYYKDEFEEYDEVVNDVFSIVIENMPYFLFESNDGNHAINMIRRKVSWSLNDMIREMNIWKKNFSPEPYNSDYDKANEDLLREISDESVNVENEGILAPYLNSVINDFLPLAIDVLQKHPERMLTYLNSVCDRTNAQLLNEIISLGYEQSLSLLIEKANNLMNINLDNLKEIKFNSCKASDMLVIHDIEIWKTRAYISIKKIAKSYMYG